MLFRTVVGDARLVQRALGGIALHAEGLRVHGDVQGKGLSGASRRSAGRGVEQMFRRSEDHAARLWTPRGSPARRDIDNTTPSGARVRRPQDVLNYISVIHNAMLTACGWTRTRWGRSLRAPCEHGGDVHIPVWTVAAVPDAGGGRPTREPAAQPSDGAFG